MGELLFLLVCTAGGVHVIRAFIKGRGLSVSITAIALLIYIVCLWIPARLQDAELITSKIYRAGLQLPPDTSEIERLCLQWSLELLLVWTAERVAWITVEKAHGANRGLTQLTDPKTTANALLVIGLLATIFFRSPELDERAAGGQGISTLLRTCFLCALAIITYYRFFGLWRYRIIVFAGIAFLIMMSVRSPLFVVLFAFIASEIANNKLRSPRRMALMAILAISLALVGSVMSSMRANITRDYGLSTAEVIDRSLENPWIAPFESGLDTLDGYRLSESIRHQVEPRPEDLLNVITTFVPRAVWPEKPTDIGVEISTQYLGYQGSGQYLSPVGYLSIILGGYAAGVIGLGIFAFVMARFLRLLAHGFWTAIVLCVAFRFFLGGSSFDMYYGLTLAVPIIAVQALLVLRPKTGKANKRVMRLERASRAASYAVQTGPLRG